MIRRVKRIAKTLQRSVCERARPARTNIRARPLRRFLAVLSIALLLPGAVFAAHGPIRVALNDLPGKGMLPIMVAIERAREAGLDVQVSYLTSENIVAQAVRSGLSDVGMGTPYQAIQDGELDVRMFYQLSKLAFFPVVNRNDYRSWKDLDDIDMYVHGPGSGTEAVMNLLAKQNGIQYRKIHYLPGSGTRARAMLQGRIRATVLDAERTSLLLDTDPRRFGVLPIDDLDATDEALFAKPEFLRSHRAQVKQLIAAMLEVNMNTNLDPGWLEAERQRFGLLPKLDEEASATTMYISDMVNAAAYPGDGGATGDIVTRDFEFYTESGTLKGNAGALDPDAFWDLSLVREAVEERRASSNQQHDD